MASPDPEINDGFTLPVWMRTKPGRDFQPFAASPPAPEESFFFMKYPKTDVIFGKQRIESDMKQNMQEATPVIGAVYNPNEKDWSKHTKPCQEVLHGIPSSNKYTSSALKNTRNADDEFKSDSACGNSIVKVANKMVTAPPNSRGFVIASPIDSPSELSPPLSMQSRRGSKSLPATPAHSPPTSPTGKRRKNGNRYFTSPFEPVDDSSNRSWLTMALMGFKKDLAESTSTLAEEDALEVKLQGVSLAESVENLGPLPKGIDSKNYTNQSAKSQTKSQGFRPKPTELREMNFWSPTSM